MDLAFRHMPTAVCSAGHNNAAASFVFSTQKRIPKDLIMIKAPAGSKEVNQASLARYHNPPSFSVRSKRSSAVKSCSDSGLNDLPLSFNMPSNSFNQRFSFSTSSCSFSSALTLHRTCCGGSANNVLRSNVRSEMGGLSRAELHFFTFELANNIVCGELFPQAHSRNLAR